VQIHCDEGDTSTLLQGVPFAQYTQTTCYLAAIDWQNEPIVKIPYCKSQHRVCTRLDLTASLAFFPTTCSLISQICQLSPNCGTRAFGRNESIHFPQGGLADKDV
jgi:hypothetical protein